MRVATFVLALLMISVVSAAGQSDEFVGTIELPRLRAYAVRNNPDIQAAEQRWRAAQARPPQEGSLPDPLLNTAWHNESLDRLQQGTSDFSWLRFGLLIYPVIFTIWKWRTEVRQAPERTMAVTNG